MFVKESTVPDPSPSLAGASATRATLLDAARDLFGRQGYAATSLQSIVEAAGLTKGAAYHHFDDKQDLFLHVFEQVQRQIGRQAFVVHLDDEDGAGTDAGAVRDLSSETNREVWRHLERGCRTYLELHMEAEVQRIVLIDGRAVLPWDDWHRVHHDHGVVLLRADLRRAMSRHIIRDVPLRPLATMLAGALHEACITITNAQDRDRALDDAMGIVRHFLTGLRADEASADVPLD